MNQNELYHYGVLGQKWGVRRYQNEDGSYKSGAKGRYSEYGQKKNYSRKEAKNLYRIQNTYESLKLEDLTTGKGKYAKELSKLEKEAGEKANAYSYDSKGNLTGRVQTSTINADKAQEKYQELFGKAEDEALKWAQDRMRDEYGDYSLEHIKKYNNQNAAISVAATLGVFGGLLAIDLMR